jgi:hypothetical protein
MKKLVFLSICFLASFGVSGQKLNKEKEVKMSLNEKGNLILHQTIEKPTSSKPFPSVSFYIYDLKKDKIIYEDFISRGKIDWHEGSILKIWKVPGMVKHNHQATDDITYIDACSGKKVSMPADQKKETKKRHDL